MFGKNKYERADNQLHVDETGVIRLIYRGPQTKETLVTIKGELLKALAEQRAAGKQVKVMADMRGITNSDSGARIESKWFLEEADWDVLAIVGNRYLQPLVFFVLRDFRHGNKIVKYFSDEKNAVKWLADPRPDTNFNRPKTRSHLKWVTGAVVAAIALSTMYGWMQIRERLDIEAKSRFESATLHITEVLEERLFVYTEALYGFRGLFHSSDSVNEREYHDYLASLELGATHPGLNSVNFITRVKDADKNDFLAQVRSDRSLRAQGDPDFAITPDSDREEHFVVTYVGAEGAGSSRGADLAVNDDRRPTLEAARDSGKPQSTGTLQLLDESGQEQANVSGFLVTIPVYQNSVPETLDGRRDQLEGFVNAVFNYQKLFDQSFKDVISDDVEVRILDGDGKVIYEHINDETDALNNTAFLPVAGRDWTVEMSAPKLFGANRAERIVPYYVAAFGALLVALLGTVLWLQNRGRQRAVELAGAMTEDIKQERNEAIATKNKDEAILSSIGDGVLVLDNEGAIVLFNNSAEKISGLRAADVTGKPYKDHLVFLDEKSGKPAADFIEKALSGLRAEMDSSTVLRHASGDMIPVADSAAPVYNAAGQVIGAVVVFRDTTRERQLEKMKDELLSVASHELRTPMGAVRANVSMILAGDYGPVNKELVEPLTDMKASTIRLVDLVNGLLNVARLDAGRMKFTLFDFGIQEVVRHEASSLAPLGKEKGVQIVFDPGREVMVQADTDKIKQILTNLIGNSLKFTDKGRITVEIAVEDEKVEISVSDTGLGISVEDQKKLFGKFQQIINAQDGKPAGTGLGLYISREMIRKMGGDLWIKRSEPGKGSTFAFTIPRSDTPDAKKAKMDLEQEAAAHPDQK